MLFFNCTRSTTRWEEFSRVFFTWWKNRDCLEVSLCSGSKQLRVTLRRNVPVVHFSMLPEPCHHNLSPEEQSSRRCSGTRNVDFTISDILGHKKRGPAVGPWGGTRLNFFSLLFFLHFWPISRKQHFFELILSEETGQTGSNGFHVNSQYLPTYRTLCISMHTKKKLYPHPKESINSIAIFLKTIIRSVQSLVLEWFTRKGK